MFRKTVTALICIFFLNTANSIENGSTDQKAADILKRTDRFLDYPDGTIKGSMLHTLLDGRAYSIRFTAYVSGSDYIFKFSSTRGRDQLKILYKNSGENIWISQVNTKAVRTIVGPFKYETIFKTNFNYKDLSNSDFHKNYKAKITGTKSLKGQDTYILTLIPKFGAELYGSLKLFVRIKDLVPLRINYYDNSNELIKSLSIIRTVERGNKKIPVQFNMIDINRATVTRLSFFSFEDDDVFDKKIFRHQALGEQ